MFDALTYQEMLKEIKKNSEKYGITDDVVAILITRPDLATGKDILNSLEYYHFRTGHSINFYLPGYGAYWTEEEYPDGKVVTEIAGVKWSFSNQRFVEFIEDMEKYSKWRYSGESDLIFAEVKNGRLSYERAMEFHLDNMLRDKAIISVNQFFEKIVRIGQEGRSMNQIGNKLGIDKGKQVVFDALLEKMPMHAEAHECYVYLVELAVDTARNENEKLVELIDQLGYMYEPTLTDYLECLENSFEFGTDENTFEVWLKLRECMARIEPTEGKVIYKQLDRIQQLIEKMEPTDIRVKHREWYLGNRYLFDKGNYANRWKMLEDKKLSAVKEIFDEYGSEEVERFGSAVKNVHDVANKLGRFLKPNEMSSIIEKCFIGILSKEFTINCLISFVYTQGAEKLLETSLCHMKDEFTLEILSKIPFSLQLLDVINQVIDDDIAYWEKGAMPYGCCEDEAEELKIIVEKLIACKRYVTAVNIIGHSECEAVINAECIYKLMKLAGTEESIGGETLDDYAVQKIIGWFQQQEDIDLELRSDIEFIYLPMLDEYSEVRPRALNTRLSLEPEYFCSLIELFYKKRNGEKREIELNKSLSDRLCEILFQFKVTPGIDWNGNFDAKRFDYWMKTVKTWSRDNDRYEAAMHTVGLGLSYAELDEDKLPQTAVIEELNRVENDELRRGYYLGTINQRGAHWVDPEGKPELELAEDYENRANIAESRGYSRYAGILRVIADEFKREAKSNILEAKNGDDE